MMFLGWPAVSRLVVVNGNFYEVHGPYGITTQLSGQSAVGEEIIKSTASTPQVAAMAALLANGALHHPQGSRRIQHLLDELHSDYSRRILRLFQFDLCWMATCPHANFVLQKLIMKLPENAVHGDGAVL